MSGQTVTIADQLTGGFEAFVTVYRVYPNGEHGPFVVCKTEMHGTLTFSLVDNQFGPAAWKGDKWPNEGDKVLAKHITGRNNPKAKGDNDKYSWRSTHVEPLPKEAKKAE